MSDMISRQDAIKEIKELCISCRDCICNADVCINDGTHDKCERRNEALNMAIEALSEQPAYVAEIEEEYQKAVNAEWIHKPLAKALYEVWKKHDREDVSRHEGL